MLNGVYTPELSASIGKRQQFFHWKTQGAGSRFAHGRRELPSPCYASSHQRVDFRLKFADQVSHFRIPLIRIRAYTFLYDETTASYSNGEMLTVEHRRRRLTKCLRSSAFYRKTLPRDGGGGSRGHQVHTECICTWLSIGFFLRTLFAIEMNGKNRPSREFRPLSQKWLALKHYGYAYKFLRLGLAQVPISVLPFGGLSEFLTIFRKIHQNSTFGQGIVSTHF